MVVFLCYALLSLKAWKKLKAYDKESLVRCFMTDGLQKQSFVFAFLPNYFASAIANPVTLPSTVHISTCVHRACVVS